MPPIKLLRLKDKLERLKSMLKAIVKDYAHCAVDEGGNLDDWRKKLIEQALLLLEEDDA